MTLLEHIEQTTGTRQSRLEAAQWVLKNPQYLKELLVYCFESNGAVSIRATWILEFVCLEDLELLYPHLDYFMEQLPTAKLDSSVRPLAHICELLTKRHYLTKKGQLQPPFTTQHKSTITSCCFDWLITNQKVACEVRAMTCLYYLGKEIDWIYNELAPILESNIAAKSAGYRARGKKILDLINKEEH